jgi:glycerol kinase
MQAGNKFSGRSFSELDLFEFYQLRRGLSSFDVEYCSATNHVNKSCDCRNGSQKIFVDGGFGKNPIYMSLLAKAFPGIEVYAATVPQASALGAALVIHHHWNKNPLPAI